MNKQALSRKLRAAGISDEVIQSVLRVKPKTIKIPRAVSKRLGEVLAEDGRAVATYRGGKFTVFNYVGYNNRIAAVSKHIHLAQTASAKKARNGR